MPIHFLDTLVRVQISGEQTGGAYSVTECLAPAGHQPPPHVHADDAEGFYVLDGELTVKTADGETVVPAGRAFHAPARVPHTFEVTSATAARFVVVSAPARFDAFATAFGTPTDSEELPVLDGPPDVARLTAVAAEHGVTFVGDLAHAPA